MQTYLYIVSLPPCLVPRFLYLGIWLFVARGGMVMVLRYVSIAERMRCWSPSLT